MGTSNSGKDQGAAWTAGSERRAWRPGPSQEPASLVAPSGPRIQDSALEAFDQHGQQDAIVEQKGSALPRARDIMTRVHIARCVSHPDHDPVIHDFRCQGQHDICRLKRVYPEAPAP